MIATVAPTTTVPSFANGTRTACAYRRTSGYLVEQNAKADGTGEWGFFSRYDLCETVAEAQRRAQENADMWFGNPRMRVSFLLFTGESGEVESRFPVEAKPLA